MAQNPPPNDPFYNPGNDPQFGMENGNGSDEELRSGAPVISAAPSRVFMVLGMAGLFLVVVLFLLFGGGSEEKIELDKPGKIASPPPRAAAPPLPPVIPDPPPQALPQPPLPKAPPIPVPPIVSSAQPTDKQRQARIRSEMLVVNNSKMFGKAQDAEAQKDSAAQDAFASSDPNLTFASRAYATSEAPKATAGFLGNLGALIAQGKLIHAVLETAINTQLPGQLRAVVSHDIYAEQGRSVLIPKGSRLLGVYNTNIFRGQDRVFIVWTRVIRPDGVDIYVNSPGVDKLGRAGQEGFLDQKFNEIFTGAILTSVISIGAAAAADAVAGGENISTNMNTDGSTTSSGDPVSFATLNAVGNISRVGRTVVEGLLDLRPTITVDQGTLINVFVNRDLYFPGNTANRTMMIE